MGSTWDFVDRISLISRTHKEPNFRAEDFMPSLDLRCLKIAKSKAQIRW